MFCYEDTFRVNYGIFSVAEQEKIRHARILIIGVGGVGGVAAIILARSGASNFTLVDPDIYTETNTNRQIGCFTNTIANFKAEVIKDDILRINPEAKIEVRTEKLPFESVDHLLDACDVYIAAADDLAYSNTTILMAEQHKKLVISQVPSGMAGYIMVFPPDSSRISDPIDLFGGPKGLSYEEIYHYIASPLNKFGRRWYVMQGRWRIEWFNRWRKNELLMLPTTKWCFKYNIWDGDSLACEGMNKEPLVPLAQICPAIWLGASLAVIEVLKFLTGKGINVVAPKMWHYELADNRIRVEKFRRRSWFFFKFLDWAFHIHILNIGGRLRENTIKQLDKELSLLEMQEKRGVKVKLPFLWRHII